MSANDMYVTNKELNWNSQYETVIYSEWDFSKVAFNILSFLKRINKNSVWFIEIICTIILYNCTYARW